MSRQAFAEKYGIDENDLQSAIEFANAHRLKVENVDRGSRRVTLSGTAAQLTRAFRVQLVRYRDPPYRTTTDPVQVPASLKDAIIDVEGFDDREQASPRV
jgi:kumamolisin